MSITAAFLLFLNLGHACSMYKITKDGKTIVGNNEDWFSPNSQFWYEPGAEDHYGVMYMGLLNDFAQGALNEAGLVFDGFANPELEVVNTEGKKEINIAEAIRHIMQTMRTVQEVKAYLSTINLSALSSSQVVFVDQSGTYLIVEGDALIIGDEPEKSFSNFYYSQINSLEEVNIPTFKNGMEFINTSQGASSIDYCSQVMEQFSNTNVFGTQYSTIYDLSTLKVRVYLFHDYSVYIELDLMEELALGKHSVMIADLFDDQSSGSQHYQKYNNKEQPAQLLKELIHAGNYPSEKELVGMGFNTVINTLGYEWLKDKEDPQSAIEVFEYGIQLMPNDADLYDSLGEAYFENKDWQLSIKNYAQSLVLDPGNENALEMLGKIKQEISEIEAKN